MSISFSLFSTTKTVQPCLRNPRKSIEIPSSSSSSTFFNGLHNHFSTPAPLVQRLVATRNLVAFNSKNMSQGMKEQKWTHEGVIVESLPNGMFNVRLDNEDVVLGYVSGKIRKNHIRMLPGDKVKIEVSKYDSTRGRIIFRLRNNRDSGE